VQDSDLLSHARDARTTHTATQQAPLTPLLWWPLLRVAAQQSMHADRGVLHDMHPGRTRPQHHGGLPAPADRGCRVPACTLRACFAGITALPLILSPTLLAAQP